MTCPVTVRLMLLFNFCVCDLLIELATFVFKFLYVEFSGGREGFCVLCVLCDHVERSLATSGGVLSPLKLVDNLNCILFNLCLLSF
jgi:hypothetical protein